ncbi:MAG: tetratricopeptide repeat protein [Acidobacteria bacterium]|nr:tetratricopeptide repeat protein [Acidobacteriota bacterium]
MPVHKYVACPLLLVLACALTLAAQQKPAPKSQEPAEEDEALTVKEYAFNPLQAEKEVKIGAYYFKKGSFRAAAQRFREAARWDPGNAEAWLRLGAAREKLKDRAAAREAYSKYLELKPDAKNAAEIRKKLARKS